jgi:glycosyltransferase involved in cell wall biosynthesis
VHVVPNVVDVDRYRSDVRSHEPTIVFTGWYRHWPNQDAARFLIKCSQQLLSEGVHHRLYLVGRDMPESIRREAADQDQIVVTGEVPDVVPYLARATVFAAPMHAASGSNLKILEAMALGKPVVTTAMGAEGLPIERGVHAAVATDPESFYGLLRHHLIRRDESEKMGQMGARWVRENMSSEALERRIHDIMEHAV